VIRECDLAALRKDLPQLTRARDRAAIEAWVRSHQPCP
jgi:phosphoenolpyruvate-protein phosphotransferase (PTS system enzyme I)